MATTLRQALGRNFLGQAPDWYKWIIVGFLLANPLILSIAGPVAAGWLLIGEFIFTLALALKCYPLQPGGLLAIEAIMLGLALPETVYHEARENFEVILLLIFMVAGIYFMKDLLLFVFIRILLRFRSKIVLSLQFSMVAAFLSAFLDALTVTAVLISVGVGFYSVYHKVASGKTFHHSHDHADDADVYGYHRKDLESFRAFLRSLLMHGAVVVWLIAGLAFHLAPVGIIGLTVIVLLTAFNGIIEEQRIGHAFTEALPFTALLVVFFAIVAVIHEQHLFTPIIQSVLAMDMEVQPPIFFAANGLLSMISDNVFVATVYINEIKGALDAGRITREQFELLAVAINTGTNIPSIATPNGQAAFLFLLTSALAPLIRLSYGRMVWMAIPYTFTMSIVGLFAVALLL